MSSDQILLSCPILSQADERIKSLGFHVRELSINDFHKGFLRVLGMLTSVGSLTFGQFMGKILLLYERSL